MANVAYPGATGIVGKTEAGAGKFIPELWSDDIIAAYKTSLVMGNLVSKITHVGKKGDTIHIPTPVRGTSFAKAENVAVTIQANAEGVTDVLIDQHFEYSRLIEDIVEVQALDSLRSFYTDDAGYALAKRIDDTIFAQFESLNGGGARGTDTWTGGVIGGDGVTAYLTAAAGNATALLEVGIRRVVQTLDDNDVPMDGRKFVIPPVDRNTILGISTFTSADFISGKPVVTGTIGDLYGMDVIVTSNCPTEVAGDTTTLHRVAMMFHKDCRNGKSKG